MSLNFFTQGVIAQHPFLFALGSLGFLLIGTITRRIYFHPLSKYPGPFLGKFSQYYQFKGVIDRNSTVLQYQLLQRYGSPCRVETNHLIFSDVQSVTDIYGQSSQPCLKYPGQYLPFTLTGARNVFNVTEKILHSRFRRLLANGFTARSLLEREELFMGKINEYIDVVFRPNEGRVIDIGPQTYHLFLDIVGVAAKAMAPGIEYLPVKFLQDALKGCQRLADFSHSMVNDYLHRLSGDNEKEELKTSLLYRLVNSTDEESGTTLSQVELEEHAIVFLTAGSGTTTAALEWFLWEVGRHPVIQDRLVREIREAFPDPAMSPTYAEVSKLSYLRQVMDESLRLWGPLSANNPRVSPGKVIGGHFIPAGTTVSNTIYITARDPTVFPNPHTFDPPRWENATSTMKLMSRPFSTGPRNCIGKHLAEINLALTISRLYQLYDIIPDPSMTEGVMRVRDHGVLKPWEDRLLIKATPAKAKV
ncbi:benzoate 4-monooxygenase cytochrome [Stagonosporopsis vannaccii]|nr:benzoate 4-monooxygenase cytochrome [Stagonosporopsis vannaccii]